MSTRIFDAHLDLAMNALLGRDITKPAREQPADRGQIATVGLPDLRAGGVTHVCGTIFCAPDSPTFPGYHNPEEAHAEALKQINYYHDLAAREQIALPADYSLAHTNDPSRPSVVTLLEGAECIRTPDDVAPFHDRGVRVVGLSWQKTRYAGGTGTPGPITDLGRDLVRVLDQHKLIHDASHLAEESFWNLLDITQGPIIASHSNCRAIVGVDPFERHLSDEMIRAIIHRGGIIGINFFDKFLLPAAEYQKRRATLGDVVAHIRHVCDLAGNADHIGIGTDMDGGLGREEIPQEIETSADLPQLRAALLAASFSEGDVQKILFLNWFHTFSRTA